MLPTPIVVRLAVRLQAIWRALAASKPVPSAAWERLQSQIASVERVHRRVRLAKSRSLSLILPHLTGDLQGQLEELTRRVQAVNAELVPSNFHAPDLGAWVADLRQVEEEFGTLTIDWKRRTIRVVTDAIVLRDVDLGPFAIVFDWRRVGQSSGAGCFVLTALAPSPAAGKSDVHHPHVQDHTLCAGDAAESLDWAIYEGRLADAFLLVRSVLTTYNPNSAYAPLEAWDGTSCSDCGRVVVQDDRFSCEGCEIDLCDQCAGSCIACSATRCSGCLQRCPVCEDNCCPGCLVETASSRSVCPTCQTKCRACESTVATDVVDESSRLCPGCSSDSADGEEELDPSPIPTEVSDPCEATTPSRDG